MVTQHLTHKQQQSEYHSPKSRRGEERLQVLQQFRRGNETLQLSMPSVNRICIRCQFDTQLNGIPAVCGTLRKRRVS